MKRVLFIACFFQVVLLKAQNLPNAFKDKIDAATLALTCPIPNEQNPVTINAKLITDASSDSIAIVVKARIADGWHLYAYVPDNKPYIVTECILNLDGNIKAVGSWEKSRPTATAMDPGVLIYEHEAVFIQKMKKVSSTAKGKISAGLNYQTCNLRQCLQPVDKIFDFIY